MGTWSVLENHSEHSLPPESKAEDVFVCEIVGRNRKFSVLENQFLYCGIRDQLEETFNKCTSCLSSFLIKWKRWVGFIGGRVYSVISDHIS